MGLLTILIQSMSHLFLIGLDVVIFFVLIRLARLKWHHNLLAAMDSLGTPIVGWFSLTVKAVLKKTGAKSLTENTVLILGLLLLCIVRIVLISIVNIMF